MNQKKFLIAAIAAMSMLVTACDKYDDGALKSSIADLENHVNDLEKDLENKVTIGSDPTANAIAVESGEANDIAINIPSTLDYASVTATVTHSTGAASNTATRAIIDEWKTTVSDGKVTVEIPDGIPACNVLLQVTVAMKDGKTYTASKALAVAEPKCEPLTKSLNTLGTNFTNAALDIVVELGKYKSDVPAGAFVAGLAKGVWAYLDAERVMHIQTVSTEAITVNYEVKSDDNGLFAKFSYVSSFKDIKNLKLEHPTSLRGMFYNCNFVRALNLSWLDGEGLTDMQSMFNGCESLANVNLSSFNSENVTNMKMLFKNCYSMQDIKLGSEFTNIPVNEKGSMFQGTAKELPVGVRCAVSGPASIEGDLKQSDITQWNTSKLVFFPL